jgi:WD40 repeat protein/serine/threonine protein kinase
MSDANLRTESLFWSALALASGEERARYLDQACGGDQQLRAHIEELLAAYPKVASFLEPPTPGPAVTVAEDPVSERPGTVIGPYKLLEEIGEGGMGTVWMAQQQEPIKRLVAIKLIKAGMDSRQVLARFEAERQALALMDHPNIAKVLDAGVNSGGRPYFVMELVKGVPLTRYCDEQRLTPRERLELFVQVCSAVQHAHQKGIIHRDLKPSNVLVALYDDRPVPKVIDFGVAKAAGQALTEKTLVTGFGTIVGTLEYMSPEQAQINQLDIDTRSDIYSLGVLLYELLTGTTPFSRKELEEAGMLEMLRVIREEEPSKPSTKLSTVEGLPTLAANRGTEPAKLTRLLRGELDWIVMKALEKDRRRRYDSASALAADVQRYLNDEPVQACPPSAGYRLRKFLRRNKGPVLAAALAVLALFGGGIGAAFGVLWHQAVLARGEAEAARDGEAKARELLAAFEYGRTMQVAHEEWRDNNIAAALALLHSTRAEFRGWEWRYLHRLCHADLRTLNLGTTAFAISADRSRVVTNGPGGTPTVRDARTGAELVTLQRPRKGVRSMGAKDPNKGKVVVLTTSASFSPDGSRVVVTSWERLARVWDATSGALVLTLDVRDEDVWSAAFDADGSRVVTGGNPTARVWDARTGGQLLTLKGHTQQIYAASFSPDGSRVVTASEDTTARLWDATSGAEVCTLKGHTERVRSASFSPDGSRVVTASWDGTARVWDTVKGAEVRTLKGHTSWVESASFSPDGSRVVTGSADTTARVWDATNGAELLILRGHTDTVTQASFSADGSRVWTASKDRTTRLWDARTETEALTLKRYTRDVLSASFSPDGSRVLATSFDQTARVWDARSGDEVLTLKGPLNFSPSASFSPDGSRILAGCDDGTAKVWDARTGAEVLVFKGHTGSVDSATWSPDGSRVVTRGSDETARVWDATSGAELFTLRGWQVEILPTSWSPGGSRVVVTKPDDKAVRVLDAWTGAELLTLKGHTSTPGPAWFSPDGFRVVTSSGDETRVWDATSGAELLRLKRLTAGYFLGSWSADGSRMLTGSNDGTARVLDARTGAEVLTLKGHTSSVTSASYSPDGSRVLTASSDKTARLWDARTGAEVLTLKGHTDHATTAAWSADGSRVLTGSKDGTAKVWDASPVPKGEGIVPAPGASRP